MKEIKHISMRIMPFKEALVLRRGYPEQAGDK